MKPTKNRPELFAFVLFLVLVLGGIFYFSDTFSRVQVAVKNLTASVFFIDSITVDGLLHNYQAAVQGKGKVTILIVPGHEDRDPGAVFKGIREADLARDVGISLKEEFKDDREFEVTLLRDEKGFNQEFLNYFENHRAELERFVSSKKETMVRLVREGKIETYVGVDHNAVSFEKALRLYAINQWVNERGIDLVLHLHFNDYPGRRRTSPGKYSGFAVYIPESQYSNAKASLAIGKSLLEKLRQFNAVSNMPKESKGLVEDQELIALGSYNTADAASILLEYGYIYEPQFQDIETRNAMIRELAHTTYLGVSSFFDAKTNLGYGTLFLPFEWRDNISRGTTVRNAVLSLQSALVLSKKYPPAGLSKNDCPVNGFFGPCTEVALVSFQKAHGITRETGVVGPETRAKLNQLFGR